MVACQSVLDGARGSGSCDGRSRHDTSTVAGWHNVLWFSGGNAPLYGTEAAWPIWRFTKHHAWQVSECQHNIVIKHRVRNECLTLFCKCATRRLDNPASTVRLTELTAAAKPQGSALVCEHELGPPFAWRSIYVLFHRPGADRGGSRSAPGLICRCPTGMRSTSST